LITVISRALLAILALSANLSFAEATVTLKIESWRYDDLPVWRDRLIPAFERKHPGIRIKFAPTAPEQYDNAVATRLKNGTAGDLITCRAFDKSLQLYQTGHLLAVNDLEGMANFSPLAKVAWSTDDGKTTFCVPMAAVIHGFIYNADAFRKLGLTAPATVHQFFSVLNKLKSDGTYIPLAMGTKDGWETVTMGYQNIGPTYYMGESGRKALISGVEKLTDPQWVAPFRALQKWRQFLGEGFEAQTYPDSQNLFTLGAAAIYPAGSWEIADFEKAPFKLGAFPPPVQSVGDTCYISDHPDIALGINPKSLHVKQAKAFLEWVASSEFATLYSNALPGFFSLNKERIELSSPLAREFASWRSKCEPTIRPTYQILSRGTPNLEDEFWVVTAGVINGTLTPEAAAERLQSGLMRWYEPQKKHGPRRDRGTN
jgi:raffinose/stachyose/melibiose transport system substrate-binding protein